MGLQNLFTPTKGGGVCLQNDGVYFVKELNAQKARLKLLIAVNAGLKGDELRAYMEDKKNPGNQLDSWGFFITFCELICVLSNREGEELHVLQFFLMHNLRQHTHTDRTKVIQGLCDSCQIWSSIACDLRIITCNDFKVFWY